MQRSRIEFLFLNVGHFLDHYFMLIFASVAALKLTTEWGMSYAGIGLSAVFASLSTTPLQMAISLTFIGVFAAIYHPVGLAMVVQGRKRTGMPLAVNGVFGALYLLFLRMPKGPDNNASEQNQSNNSSDSDAISRTLLIRVFSVIFFTTAIGGLIFQSTTFALPKVFDERLGTIAVSATQVGWYTFLVFAVAAFAQLVVGYLVDHFSIRKVFAWVAFLQALFFVVMIPLAGLAALAAAVAFMLVVFGQIPINDVLVGRMAKSEWRSRAYALRYVVTFSVMATAVPLIAWVHGTWGFNVLFAILAIAATLIFLAVLTLPQLR